MKIAKCEIIIVRSEEETCTEWGVSIGGPNPEQDKYFAVKDYDNALRLSEILQSNSALVDKALDIQRELSDVREMLAVSYMELSGKEFHASDCSTSISPAQTPGRCDCDC